MPCERKIWLIVLSLMTMLSSCSLTSLREAQEVVAQADSLWHEGRMYGVDEGDLNESPVYQAGSNLGSLFYEIFH